MKVSEPRAKVHGIEVKYIEVLIQKEMIIKKTKDKWMPQKVNETVILQ